MGSFLKPFPLFQWQHDNRLRSPSGNNHWFSGRNGFIPHLRQMVACRRIGYCAHEFFIKPVQFYVLKTGSSSSSPIPLQPLLLPPAPHNFSVTDFATHDSAISASHFLLSTLTVHFLLSRRSRAARRQMNFCISPFLDFSILYFLFRPSLHHKRWILEKIPADMIKELARQAH